MNKRIRKKFDYRCGYKKYNTYREEILWFERGVSRLDYIKTKYLCNRHSRYCRLSRPNMVQPLSLDTIETLRTMSKLPSPYDPELQRFLCNHYWHGELIDPVKNDNGELVCPICLQPWENCIDEEKVKQTIKNTELEISRRAKALEEEKRHIQMDLPESSAVKLHKLPSYIETAYEILLDRGEIVPFPTVNRSTMPIGMAMNGYPVSTNREKRYIPSMATTTLGGIVPFSMTGHKLF